MKKRRKKKRISVSQRKPLLGSSPLRKEGKEKLTGQAKYIDDLSFPGMWHGVTVRSQIPRGKIQKIIFEPNVPWEEITVVQAKDIPGKNFVDLIEPDQPFLAETVIQHPEEPILLLAHPDRYLLEKARKSVRIETKELKPVFSLEESLQAETIIWGKDNVFKSYLLEKGDVDSVWGNAAKIIEGEYRTGAQEQLYLEPNGMIALANPTDGVTVWGSMQCPYYVHKALMTLFGLPGNKVRIIQTETGGGFGGKEDYPSLIAGHAALLAWKTGRPIKMIYDRQEDMVATTKRHPSYTKVKAAVDSQGNLLALDIHFVLDGGAYVTLSPVVLSRGTIHAPGPYRTPNVRVKSSVVATNTPPHGAFRGFGAPQSLFAIERHMDRVAKAIGLSPVQFRKRNLLKAGDSMATGQKVPTTCDLAKVLELALKESDFEKKQRQFAQWNQKSHTKRGMGLAVFMHGAGFTGSGESYLASKVAVELTSLGRVRILTANTEIGQGTNTIFSQIAADALGIDYDDIEVAQPDTAQVPNSGPTVASRTCMIVGQLVGKACEALKSVLRQSGAPAWKNSREFRRTALRHLKTKGPLKTFADYQAPPGKGWDDKRYQGDAYGAYGWAAYVAEVSVDTRTYQVTCEDFVAVQEIGKVVHPAMARGQIIGGVAQAIGFALYEKVVWREGRMANATMTNYLMPTSSDLPPIRVFFLEDPYAFGPQGAKGIGELPMDGPAPAILNAVGHALKVNVSEIPALPEAIFEACRDAKAQESQGLSGSL